MKLIHSFTLLLVYRISVSFGESTSQPATVVSKCSITDAVAILFDNGPDTTTTPEILRILKENGIAFSSFALIGKYVDAIPNIAKSVASEGHLIVSHTYNHLNLNTLSETGIKNELEKASEAYLRVSGAKPEFLMPPVEAPNSTTLGIIKRFGYVVIQPTYKLQEAAAVDGDPLTAVKNRIRNVVGTEKGKESVIFVMEENTPSFVQQLPQIISYIQNQKFDIISLTQCTGDRFSSSGNNDFAFYIPHVTFAVAVGFQHLYSYILHNLL